MAKNKLIDANWEKLWEKEEYKELNYEPYYELAGNDYRLFEEWNEIIKASNSNITLQKAIEQVKIIHALSKDYGP